MAYLDVGRIHLVRHKREFLELREARKSMNDSSWKKPFSNELLLSFYREIKSSNTRHRAWEDKRSFYHSSRSGRELFGARKWFRTLEKLAAHPFSLSLSLSLSLSSDFQCCQRVELLAGVESPVYVNWGTKKDAYFMPVACYDSRRSSFPSISSFFLSLRPIPLSVLFSFFFHHPTLLC